MRIMPISSTFSNIPQRVRTCNDDKKLLIKNDDLPVVSFNGAAKNAAKIISGALAGTVICVATGGIGLLAPVIATAIGAFTCEGDKNKDDDLHSDYTSEYYP